MKPLIEIKNLSFAYRGSETPAVKDVNLEIAAGEFVVLCGTTGCGKSTLLRCIKPAVTPMGTLNGKILFNGRDVAGFSERELARRIGFVMQDSDSGIVCDKVWHELAFGLESIGTAPDIMRRLVAETAGYFGLEPFFEKDVETLSGGQKQILSLASVMVMRPDVLILDEPVSELDPASAEKFLSCLKRLNNDLGVTVILAEHRTDEIVTLADRLIVMDDGRILCDDAPEEAGTFLNRAGSPLFEMMPAAMRVFGGTDAAKLPVTVRDARKLLAERLAGGDASVEIPSGNKAGEVGGDKKSKDPVLSCKNMCFGYDKNDIINDMNLEVKKGEIFCLMGANGCGKSTLLSLIAGINRLKSGRITFNGRDIGKYKGDELYRNGIAMLPQDPKILFSKDTVYDEIRDVAGLLNVEMEREEIIHGLMETMRLEKLAGRHPYDLSGGEKQRLALALVMASRPKLILMDEPTKGLDAVFKRELGKMLKDLSGNGISVLLVSHDTEFCAEYADRCALMFAGEIITVSGAKGFFAENMFWSTTAFRIADGFIPGAVTVDDVKKALK